MAKEETRPQRGKTTQENKDKTRYEVCEEKKNERKRETIDKT